MSKVTKRNTTMPLRLAKQWTGICSSIASVHHFNSCIIHVLSLLKQTTEVHIRLLLMLPLLLY